MQREGGCAVVRQGHLIAAVLMVLLVALLYLSPAYGRAGEEQTSQIPVTSSGQHIESVSDGTPVTVLGVYHGPANVSCPPAPPADCKPYKWAVVRLPNEKVVLLPYRDVNYQTQTVSLGKFTSVEVGDPLTPAEVNRYLGLPGTGGAALLPLLGAVMLIGGGLVACRLLLLEGSAK
jgi:hypothetical protein